MLPPDEIQLAKNGLSKFIRASILEAFIHRRNDITIKRDRLKQYQQYEKVITNNLIL
jgi:hypothetical protein